VRFLLRLVARHTGLAVALAVGSPSRERAGEMVGVLAVVQAAPKSTGILLDWETRHGPGEPIVVEGQGRERRQLRQLQRDRAVELIIIEAPAQQQRPHATPSNERERARARERERERKRRGGGESARERESEGERRGVSAPPPCNHPSHTTRHHAAMRLTRWRAPSTPPAAMVSCRRVPPADNCC
jgi:hypothetical protein